MRADLYLTEKGLVASRSLCQKMIKNGQITVNGRAIDKPAFDINDGDEIKILDGEIGKYVSRGGLKLEGALDAFKIDVDGLVCVDIGSSTGGFTDCLLKRGAKRVYAVDSGRDQLVPEIKNDPRVTALEGFNAKELSSEVLGRDVDFAVMDVSFISQTKLYPALVRTLKNGGGFVSLVKPQFEVGRENVGKGGIVKDEKKRRSALEGVINAAKDYGLTLVNTTVSPIKGGDGNEEYLAYFILKG